MDPGEEVIVPDNSGPWSQCQIVPDLDRQLKRSRKVTEETLNTEDDTEAGEASDPLEGEPA